jgi:hypothetical protein
MRRFGSSGGSLFDTTGPAATKRATPRPKLDGQRGLLIRRLNSLGVKLLPDTDRFKFRFDVRSQTSGSLYLVSYDDAPGAKYWVCSCRGCISHGHCKHLESMGLAGRKLAKVLPLSDRRRQLPG